MEIDLFIVILVKENGEKQLLFKESGDFAVYSSRKKAEKFALKKKMLYSSAEGEYTVVYRSIELGDIT